MARRLQSEGFDGGVARWVERAEVAELAGQVAGLRSTGDLAAWSESAPLGPMLPPGAARAYTSVMYFTRAGHAALNGGDDIPLTDADLDEVLQRAIVDLGRARRVEAIRTYARRHRLDLPAAVGTDMTGRSLARCPTCRTPLDLGVAMHFYCPDHLAEERAEVTELLGGVEDEPT